MSEVQIRMGGIVRPPKCEAEGCPETGMGVGLYRERRVHVCKEHATPEHVIAIVDGEPQ